MAHALRPLPMVDLASGAAIHATALLRVVQVLPLVGRRALPGAPLHATVAMQSPSFELAVIDAPVLPDLPPIAVHGIKSPLADVLFRFRLPDPVAMTFAIQQLALVSRAILMSLLALPGTREHARAHNGCAHDAGEATAATAGRALARRRPGGGGRAAGGGRDVEALRGGVPELFVFERAVVAGRSALQARRQRPLEGQVAVLGAAARAAAAAAPGGGRGRRRRRGGGGGLGTGGAGGQVALDEGAWLQVLGSPVGGLAAARPHAWLAPAPQPPQAPGHRVANPRARALVRAAPRARGKARALP
mmetsp:Transcript_10216/g.31881  ORF Transcript_10216/g.31881 Transcript_10216/m.31881 type:complete len:304 (+) Transcript_10216:387-1298(+)